MHYLEEEQAIFLDEDRYDDFYKDIKKSKQVIEKNLGVEVTSLAYPFGNTNDEIAKCVKEAGFDSAFILAPHAITNKNDAYYQNRYMIDRKNYYSIFGEWIQSKND